MKDNWFDRTREYAARNQREEITRLQLATKESVILSPIPCWTHLSPEAYRARIAKLVKEGERLAEALLLVHGLFLATHIRKGCESGETII